MDKLTLEKGKKYISKALTKQIEISKNSAEIVNYLR
jgi:hypothetical protein